MNTSFFDFHVHPTIKLLGHTYKTLLKDSQQIKPDILKSDFMRGNTLHLYKAINKASIWHNEQPNYILNPLFGELAFTKFNKGEHNDSTKRILTYRCIPSFFSQNV
jgi:hypothetical protein